MEMTKCPKCGSNLRYRIEQVGVDIQNTPVCNKWGYCDKCMSKYNLDVLEKREYVYSAKEEKKNSKLSIWAIVLSMFGITAFVSLILSVIDLLIWNPKEKHHWSLIAIIISVLSLIFLWDWDGEEATYELGTIEFSAESESTPKPQEVIVESDVEYIICTVDEMVELLGKNAMRAEKEYSDKYIELTGEINVIDSDGEYISLSCAESQWSYYDVQCYMVNQEQKDEVYEMENGQVITVRIKCTEVGEVMGFSGTIIEFVK